MAQAHRLGQSLDVCGHAQEGRTSRRRGGTPLSRVRSQETEKAEERRQQSSCRRNSSLENREAGPRGKARSRHACARAGRRIAGRSLLGSVLLRGRRPPMSALLKLRVGRRLGVPPLEGAIPSLLDFKANNDGGSPRRKKR